MGVDGSCTSVHDAPNASRPQLTQQDDDAGQDGDERPGAEAGGQDVGLHVAGQDGVFAVTRADPDGQRVDAADRRHAVVVDLDGEVVHVLRQTAEPFAYHVDAGCAVCGGTEGGVSSTGGVIASEIYV